MADKFNYVCPVCNIFVKDEQYTGTWHYVTVIHKAGVTPRGTFTASQYRYHYECFLGAAGEYHVPPLSTVDGTIP